jgi:hypothetical protein
MIRSTTIIYDVLRKQDMTPISYMLCDLVYKYTSHDGYCDVTLSDLAFQLNSSSRTMSRYVTELTEKGLIENVGTKAHPKFRTTPTWFMIAVSDNKNNHTVSLKYQEVCTEVINYINERYGNKYLPRTYEKRFKSILSKKFNGKPITGSTMVNVFMWCKENWSQKYQSSVTPEVIFGNKFIEKYLIQYTEWETMSKVTPNRKNIAII